MSRGLGDVYKRQGYNNGIVNIEKYEGDPVPPDCERDIFQIEEQ